MSLALIFAGPGTSLFVSNKGNIKNFKLRDYQRDQPQGHNIPGQTDQLDLQGAFKQEEADDSNRMHSSKCRPNNDI